jgi:hypothetical protein
MRGAFTDPTRQYLALFLAVLLFTVDYRNYSETLLFDLFILSFLVIKFGELVLKIEFIRIYSTPSLSWGSIYHIALQPLGIPHTILFLSGLVLSTIISAPLFPIIGSALWFMSYPRSVKYWEKDYVTSRKDSTNTKLSNELQGGAVGEYSSNNLNSIFYEHMVIALQNAIPNATRRGQFGNLTTGDMFIIMNDNVCTFIILTKIVDVFDSFCRSRKWYRYIPTTWIRV